MSTTEIVRCPACRGTHHADIDDTAFDCPLCSSEWRWAICEACDCVELALAGQESWRCSGCARYTRAWWRTGSAAADAARVRRRRHDGRDAIIQARLAGPRRKRRLVATVGMGVGTMVAVVVGLVTVFASGSSVEEQTRVACVRFGELRSDIANGALGVGELAVELEIIRGLAGSGEPSVASAARRLVPPTEANSASFLVAQSRFANACERFSAG